MALGDEAQAAPPSTEALAAAPNDSQVWTDVARFRRTSGDMAGAIEAADRPSPLARATSRRSSCAAS
jgi:hypothetical protein